MNTRCLLAAIVAALAPAVSACAQSGPAEEAVWFEPASEQARTLRSIVPADDARPSDEVEARLLAAHNRERAQANTRPLIWSERLEAEARDWIVRVGLKGFEGHHPHQLSGGMRKRVALAQTFINNPEILLMDEPFSALDMQTRTLMQDELLQLWSGNGGSVVFVTHDLEEAIALADRVFVL
eukprot:gene56859-biopygen47100